MVFESRINIFYLVVNNLFSIHSKWRQHLIFLDSCALRIREEGVETKNIQVTSKYSKMQGNQIENIL